MNEIKKGINILFGENKMTEKIQMTEKQAIDLIFTCIDSHYINVNDAIERLTRRMHENGYIRKSDLEILVEECEEYYKRRDVTYEQIIDKLYSCIQALKKDHPAFKERC